MSQCLKIFIEFNVYLSILEYYGLFSVSLKNYYYFYNLAITFVFDKKLDIVAMNYHLVAIPMPTVFLIVMLWLCKMKCVLPILWKLMVSLASTYQDMYLTNGVSFEQGSDPKIIWTWFCDILKWQYLFSQMYLSFDQNNTNICMVHFIAGQFFSKRTVDSKELYALIVIKTYKASFS